MSNATWKTVRTSDGGLALRLPENWQMDPPGQDPDTVLIAAPTDGVDPILVVTREIVADGVSANDYLTGNIIPLQQRQAGRRDLGGGVWQTASGPVAWYCYAHPATTGDMMQILLAAVRSPTAAYLLNCGALSENFPRHRPIVEEIMRSIAL